MLPPWRRQWSELKKNQESIESLHDIFLVDEENRLRATVPLAKLLFAAGDTPLKEFAVDPLLSIQPDNKTEPNGANIT